METVAAYWTRKNAELALLARAAGVPAPEVSTRARLLAEKQRMRAALLCRGINDYLGLTESNLGSGNRGRFRYTYQRFNLKVGTRSLFDEVYTVDRRRGPAFGLWGASGMGVITAALRALDSQLDRPRRLLFPADCYFETRGVFPFLNKLLPNVDEDALLEGDLFLLDSASAGDRSFLLERAPISGLQIVLFDTTCHDVGSPFIARVVARCEAERVPLLLMRSHLKLDCLGTEYARLGSAVIWMPPRPAPALVARLRKLRDALFNELARAGATALPNALWPLSGDPEFRALNQLHNQRMSEANTLGGTLLRKSLTGTRVTVPHHGCFIFIWPPRARRLRRDCEELMKRLNAEGLEARIAPAFCYDIIGLGVIAPGAKDVIRVALPDLPDEDVARFAEVFARYWQE